MLLLMRAAMLLYAICCRQHWRCRHAMLRIAAIAAITPYFRFAVFRHATLPAAAFSIADFAFAIARRHSRHFDFSPFSPCRFFISRRHFAVMPYFHRHFRDATFIATTYCSAFALPLFSAYSYDFDISCAPAAAPFSPGAAFAADFARH